MKGMRKLFAGVSVAAVAVLGASVLAPTGAYASTYDPATNTINASLVNDSGSGFDGTYGFWGTSGADFVSDGDVATNGITITGSIDDIRGTLVYMHDYIDDPVNAVQAAPLEAALANVPSLILSVTGDAEITPNDLGYVKYLTNYVGNTNDPTVAINVNGNVTFGPGTTAVYINDDIADVATDKFSLSATGTITLPAGYGSNITGFLGSAVIKAGNTVVSDGITYVATANNVFEAKAATSPIEAPTTGVAGSSTTQIVMIALGVLAISVLAIGATYRLAVRK